jgi:purine-nucleoside phosphorylase
VHETVLARFLGLEVAALSMITNLASGMTGAPLSHAQTKAEAKLGAGKLERLLRRYLTLLSTETEA